MKDRPLLTLFVAVVLIIALFSACNNNGRSKTYRSSSSYTYSNTTKNTPRPASSQNTTTADPYVGMIVTTVPDTWEWGGTDNTTVSGQHTTKYRYDTPSKIFSIWVNESNVVVKVNYTEIGASSSSRTGRNLVPSPDVSDFNDPEDFYEWYRDDFSDFEDAEEYYYDNGGW